MKTNRILMRTSLYKTALLLAIAIATTSCNKKSDSPDSSGAVDSGLTGSTTDSNSTDTGSTTSPSTTTTSKTPVEQYNSGVTLYANNCASCHQALASSEKRGKSALDITTAISDVNNINMNTLDSLKALTADNLADIAYVLNNSDPSTTTGTGSGTSGSSPGSPPAVMTNQKAVCNATQNQYLDFQVESTMGAFSGTDVAFTKLVSIKDLTSNFMRYQRRLAFFRWNVDATGKVIVFPELTPFYLIDANTGKLLSHKIKFLTADILTRAIRKMAPSETISSDSLSMVRFAVEIGPKGVKTSPGLIVAMYTRTTCTPFTSLSLLTPEFEVNPNLYSSAQTPRAKMLRLFHPLIKMTQDNLTEDQYAEKMREICSPVTTVDPIEVTPL